MTDFFTAKQSGTVEALWRVEILVDNRKGI